MEFTIMSYVHSFFIGGLVCLVGQILINGTHMSSARILVLFLGIGALLEAFGWFSAIESVGKAGVTVPILGFGKNLAKGAIEGARTNGLLGALGGGLSAVGGVLTVAIVIGFFISLIFKARTKE